MYYNSNSFPNIRNREIHRGDIFYVLKYDTVGSEQESGRPGIIVSNDSNNYNSNTVEVVYLTTQPKKDLPTHVITRATGVTSTVLCEQITTVSIDRIGKYVGAVTDDDMAKIEDAMATSLGLSIEPAPEVATDDAETIETVNSQSLMKIEIERDMYKNLYEQLLTKITGGKYEN